MAEHDAITRAAGLSIYFYLLAGPRLRATMDNTNGPLRQSFPEGIDMSIRSRSDFMRGQRELNNRHRKSLKGRAPAQVSPNSR